MSNESVDRDLALAEELQEEWVRVTWAATYLGIDPTIIYRRAKNGRIDSLRLETGVSTVFVTLVSRAQILNWDTSRLPHRGGRPRKNQSHQNPPKEDDE